MASNKCHCFIWELTHIGYEAEIKRQNEVMKKDRIQELREQLSDANKDINYTNKALNELRWIQMVEYGGLKFIREPQLSEYYKPSKEMQ